MKPNKIITCTALLSLIIADLSYSISQSIREDTREPTRYPDYKLAPLFHILFSGMLLAIFGVILESQEHEPEAPTLLADATLLGDAESGG